MQVNVLIKYIDAQTAKKGTTTVSYVNPQATNAKLLALAQALNTLTQNTFVNATKEIKGEIL